MSQSVPNQSVLFVCMGNICRSPSAEGFFVRRLRENDLEGVIQTDSAGTHSYHVGSPPDSRAINMAPEYGVDIGDLRARRIQADDFRNFDLIIAMDENNLRTIERFRHEAGEMESRARLKLMMEFSPDFGHQPEVPDPYYGGLEDFRIMFDLLEDATVGLLNAMRGEGDGGSA